MGDTVASQLIRYKLPRLIPILIEQSLKEAFRCVTVTPSLKKYVDHFTMLVHRPPQRMLFAPDLHQHFIDEERTSIALVSAFQSSCK
jgi:hypothetical protein